MSAMGEEAGSGRLKETVAVKQQESGDKGDVGWVTVTRTVRKDLPARRCVTVYWKACLERPAATK